MNNTGLAYKIIKINDVLSLIIETIDDDYFKIYAEFYIEHIKGKARHHIGSWDNERTLSFINQFIEQRAGDENI